MQFMRLREDWLRLNAKLFGHRLLMDRVVPGGVNADLDRAGSAAILAQCRAVESDLRSDVAARAQVRFAEISESLRLIRDILARLPDGGLRAEVRSEPDKRGFGWVEGWRGDVLIALETGSDGKLRRCHCHDPSWQNWPVLEHAVMDNIVPNFPLINKSFNLSSSGPDL